MPAEANRNAAIYLAALSDLIDASGLSIAAFARLVVGRDERTVRRWLSCEIDIPRQAGEWMQRVRIHHAAGEITIRFTVPTTPAR
jgi:hypothetical protein